MVDREWRESWLPGLILALLTIVASIAGSAAVAHLQISGERQRVRDDSSRSDLRALQVALSDAAAATRDAYRIEQDCVVRGLPVVTCSPDDSAFNRADDNIVYLRTRIQDGQLRDEVDRVETDCLAVFEAGSGSEVDLSQTMSNLGDDFLKAEDRAGTLLRGLGG